MFLVHSTLRPPVDLSPEEVADRNRRETEAATTLQTEGRLLQLWREVGTRNAWGVWNADTEDELTDMLTTLPWATQMTFEIFPITIHPNAVDRKNLA